MASLPLKGLKFHVLFLFFCRQPDIVDKEYLVGVINPYSSNLRMLIMVDTKQKHVIYMDPRGSPGPYGPIVFENWW